MCILLVTLVFPVGKRLIWRDALYLLCIRFGAMTADWAVHFLVLAVDDIVVLVLDVFELFLVYVIDLVLTITCY